MPIMSKHTYNWKDYHNSDQYKKDRTRVFKSNSSNDCFDRHIDKSGSLTYAQLTTPFNV